MHETIIIGGGLSGLVNALLLARAGREVLLIEKKEYPFHRVCGEYVSNETLPFLQSIGFDPFEFGAVQVNRFGLTSPNGTRLEMPLDMGAFGLSRYTMDHALYEIGKAAGVQFLLGEKVLNVTGKPENFEVHTQRSGKLKAKVVIGAQGKRSQLDAALNREFFRARSPWVGVKHHLQTDHPEDLIELHNFRDGYCGISRVEEGKVCLCYLVSREQVRKYGNIGELETNLLRQNPALDQIFTESTKLWKRPQVINEISFERKPLVERSILMSGDAGGMIAPLCGNGMAMAIHSAKILNGALIPYLSGQSSRNKMEAAYRRAWKKEFSTRLWMGRTVQRFFGNPTVTEGFVRLFKNIPGLARKVVKSTHGDLIQPI